MYIHNLYNFLSAVHLWKGFKIMLWSVPSNIYLLTWQILLFKDTYCAFKVNIFSVDVFPGILSHDLGVSSTIIYQFRGSRMYSKMHCVILIWIIYIYIYTYKIYSIILIYWKRISALHETLLRQKGAFSNNLIAAQSCKRDTGSFLFCQPSGWTVHSQLKMYMLLFCLLILCVLFFLLYLLIWLFDIVDPPLWLICFCTSISKC